jgi:hypothetical protein
VSGGLVRILTTPDVFEGMIVRSRLEDEGIPVMTSGDDGPYRIGPVHVFVPAEFEVQARLVIDTLRAAAAVADAPDEPDPGAGTPRTTQADEREREERA